MLFFIFAVIFPVACFVIGFMYLRNDKSVAWQMFFWFPLLTAITTLFGRIVVIPLFHSDVILFNFSILLETAFMCLFFAELLSQYLRRIRLITFSAVIIITISWCFEALFYRGLFAFFKFTWQIAEIIFIVFSFWYLYFLLTAKLPFPLTAYPPFWWVFGTLLYYVGVTVTQFIRVNNFSHLNYTSLSIITSIYYVLEGILYSFWSYSFIKKRRYDLAEIKRSNGKLVENAYKRLAYDFFISHAGKERRQSELLYNHLSARSNVFVDFKVLKPGDRWQREIPKALMGSKISVFLLTKASQDSYYLDEEVVYAIQLLRMENSIHKITRIDFQLSQLDKLFIPYGLHSIQAIEAYNDQDLKLAADRLLNIL